MTNSIELKKGDKVVSMWGLEKRVMQVASKPKVKNGVLYLPLLIDGVKRDCLAQWWRLADISEIEAGERL